MTYITDTQVYAASQPTLLARFRTALALQKQRRMLSTLSDEALNDIGLTRAEADRECAKTFLADLFG